MTKRKTKAPAAPAAQTREEVDQLIGRLGEIQRELQRQDADLGDVVAKAKQLAEERALPLKDELARAEAQVQGWCEANRTELTREGRTKTAEFTTGKISWRARPPKVSLRGVEAVVAYLLDNRLRKFLRISYEVDKEAMLKAPLEATKVPGVTIGSAGEDFIIEPFEGQLAQVA